MAVTNTATTVQNIQPQYSTETNAAVAGGIQGMLGNNGYLNSVMGNWYNQDPTQGALGQYAQYDPNNLSQYTNPYVQNVVNANNQQSNQNLQENILPGVNSTFTGNGQFGSTRNADFTNRAIRDNQQTLNNANARVMMNAQNQANSNYRDWTQMGVNAGQQDYTNWFQKVNFPVGALGTLAQSAGIIESNTPLATSTNVTTGAKAYDPTNLEKTVAALGALNTGANDGTIDWLTGLLG